MAIKVLAIMTHRISGISFRALDLRSRRMSRLRKVGPDSVKSAAILGRNQSICNGLGGENHFTPPVGTRLANPALPVRVIRRDFPLTPRSGDLRGRKPQMGTKKQTVKKAPSRPPKKRRPRSRHLKPPLHPESRTEEVMKR